MGDLIDFEKRCDDVFVSEGIELYMDTVKDYGRFWEYENVVITLYLYEKDLNQIMVMWPHMLLLLTWYLS